MINVYRAKPLSCGSTILREGGGKRAERGRGVEVRNEEWWGGREFMRVIRFDFQSFFTHLQLTHTHLFVNRFLFLTAPHFFLFTFSSQFSWGCYCAGVCCLLLQFVCCGWLNARNLVQKFNSMMNGVLVPTCQHTRAHTRAQTKLNFYLNFSVRNKSHWYRSLINYTFHFRLLDIVLLLRSFFFMRQSQCRKIRSAVTAGTD